MSRTLAVLATTTVLVGLSPGVAAADDDGGGEPGAPGIGDPYYPLDGNGGYDVEHYDLDLRYETSAPSQAIDGEATITARATQALSSLNLDFAGDSVGSVSVDGRPEYHLFGWTTPGFVPGEWAQARKTQAEMVRLLYVATTRAKQRLVVSGGWLAPGKLVPPEAAAEFAGLIGRRLDPEAISAQVENDREREMNDETRVQQVIPAFAERTAESDGEKTTIEGWFPSDRQMRAIDELAVARRAAGERMALPVIRSASAEAHERLRRADGEEGEPAMAAAGSRNLAMAIGTAVHQLLETIDLDADLRSQVGEGRDRILTEVVSGLDEQQVAEAEGTIDDLLAKLTAGPCLDRLSTLAPAVIARELPVFGWEECEGAPGTVVSGIVDLVYRDPDDGRLVVADYKTDALDDEAAFEERARIYEPQVRTYAKILRDALDLEQEPHVELWFLAADRTVRF